LLGTGEVGRCCGTRCVDPSTDTQNCGQCGLTCEAGSSCVAMGTSGECGTSTPGGGFSAAFCTGPGSCPAGTQCYTGGAAVGFCARLDCIGLANGSACYLPDSPQSGMCCGGGCIDPRRNPNCGACGTGCSSGVCLSLPGAIANDVTCLPVGTGGCGGAGGCSASDACVGGACVARACTDYGALCLVAADVAGICCAQTPGGPPSCIDVASDAANCGQCNTACPAGLSCVRGLCRLGP
jgi:hypothetical protein